MALEQFFICPRTIAKLRRGPLGDHLKDFSDYLIRQGFSRSTSRRHLCNVSHFNEHFREQRTQSEVKITAKDVEAFFEVYSSQCRNRGDLEKHLNSVRNSINRFIDYLNTKKLYDPLTPSFFYEPLLEDYLGWMRHYQYAATRTLDLRRHYLIKFLDWLGPLASAETLIELTGDRVEEFYIAYAKREGRAARRSMQATLRTFFRFCYHKGHTELQLDQAVPTMRTYKLSSVPRGLSDAQAQNVLHSVDRNNAIGRRDYAILLLLHTFGVRSGQVRALGLKDIQWSRNRILFRPLKSGKESLLPLTTRVGESLLDYLENARPPCSFPEVFLTCTAPIRPLAGSNTLAAIVGRRIRESGIEVPSKGAHAFRHAFATRMIREGHSLKAVADVLGHRHLSTTFIYTKVDFNALKQVALEWPTEV